MKKIVWYLIGWLVVALGLSVIDCFVSMPVCYTSNILFIRCSLMGVIGGVLYGLRGIYLNTCVGDGWDDKWRIWYYLRPVTSGICGFVSCIFLKAGLLVLEASENPEAVSYGYLALAFIAGYNVDCFLKKLESIAQTLWGIKKSRVGKDSESSGDSEE